MVTPGSSEFARSEDPLPPSGDAAHAGPEWWAQVYPELRALARRYLALERRGHTLQTTALAHEAYLRLAQQIPAAGLSRADFCARAAQTIRRILVDAARRKRRQRRGGGQLRQVALAAGELTSAAPAVDLLALNDALARLAAVSVRQAQIVELRFFGGMTDDEIAASLGVSRRTVQLDWRYARAWLQREISDESGRTAGAS